MHIRDAVISEIYSVILVNLTEINSQKWRKNDTVKAATFKNIFRPTFFAKFCSNHTDKDCSHSFVIESTHVTRTYQKEPR